MTAEEAKKLSDEKNSEIELNLDDVFKAIDSEIGNAASEGEYSITYFLYGCNKSWEQIHKERETIEKHYQELGYKVESLGYDGTYMFDEFVFSWK